MLWFLFLLFTIIIIESAVFSWVGDLLGLWPTVAGIIATGIIGGSLIRKQSLVAVLRLRDSLQPGQFPTREVLEAICICMCGLALIFPGFASDFLGLLLLIKPFRHWIGAKALQQINQKKTFSLNQQSDNAPIIEGEFHEVENSKYAKRSKKPNDNSVV